MQVSETVCAQGAALFDVDPASFKPLGGSDGAVYACRKGSLGHVIKFIPMTGDNVPAYEEKLAFIHYLGENGVPVAAPLPSCAGRLYERVTEGEAAYTIVLMHLADGRNPQGRNLYDWNERMFRAWGQVMGQMHRLAQGYPTWRASSLDPSDAPATRIHDWRNEHAFFYDWCKDDKVRQRWAGLRGVLEELPVTRDSFGLVHNDLHQHNFFYNPDARQGTGITIIDFDVCSYHWFATDIGIALYHATLDGARGGPQERRLFARRFLGEFMAGYEQENHLDARWLVDLPLFLRYREMLLYTVFSNEWPADRRNRWQVQWLSKARARILRGESIIPA